MMLSVSGFKCSFAKKLITLKSRKHISIIITLKFNVMIFVYYNAEPHWQPYCITLQNFMRYKRLMCQNNDLYKKC